MGQLLVVFIFWGWASGCVTSKQPVSGGSDSTSGLDDRQVRGVWRRASLQSYIKKKPLWETLIDFDDLSQKEKEPWVYKGHDCLLPAHERCLIKLSRGGKDAVIVREFDIKKRSFVDGGFFLKEFRSDVTWVDADTVLVGTDFGPNTITASGYPRQTRVWRRGQSLLDAKIILQAEVDDLASSGWRLTTSKGSYVFATISKNFWSHRMHLVLPNHSLRELPLPHDADVKLMFGSRLLSVLRSDWTVGAKKFLAGSLVAINLETLHSVPELVLPPSTDSTLESLVSTRDGLFAVRLKNVRSEVLRLVLSDRQAPEGGESPWTFESLGFANDGTAELWETSPYENVLMVGYQDFLSPPSLYLLENAATPGTRAKKIWSLPRRFDPKPLSIERFFAKSKDGTKIPYSVVRPRHLKMNGAAATLLFGYGGFEISLSPWYLSYIGRVWSERGGVYVVANIRGGGEFGPRWHQAALKENRQRAFDDFAAVAEDLIRRKITRAENLGIMGGSNGGLLVGATAIQRPELFKAVVCQVPLLDMLRYHKLLAGHSWIGEYGDPKDPQMAASLRQYSPYQNLLPGRHYPRFFFLTSTKDDRVHPGHARKMAARMEEFGYSYDYFENIEGGHSAAADLEQKARFRALIFTFLSRELGLP